MIRPEKLWLSCRAKCWGRTRLILKKLRKVVLSHNNLLTPAHSVRRLFTGLALAARRVRTLTVPSAISSAALPASTKTHQLIATRYAYACIHRWSAHHARGQAIRFAIRTSPTKFLDNRKTTSPREA